MVTLPQSKISRGRPAPVLIGLIIRNSTVRQVGNYRSESQAELAERLKARGYAVRAYDEQGTSGADLAKRKVATQMLDDLKRGDIQGIAAYDVKRLTRDEFGVDGGTIARRIVEAGGRFITWDKEYDLRNEDDLLQFQFQCFIAGIDWRNIRNTMWSGIFKRVELEPMFWKPPLGYMTEYQTGDRPGRTIKRPAKNPEHAAVMAELERALDESTSLREVVRRLTAARVSRPSFNGRGGPTSAWTIQAIRYLLKNPIYTGTYVFGRFAESRGRSTVWGKFALDQDGNYQEFVHHVPELAYWEPARMRRWQRKFGGGTTGRKVRKYPHPLAGVLNCASCGQQMIGAGEDTYACPANGTGGTYRDGGVCGDPQWQNGRIAMTLLRTVLPAVMFSAQDLASEAVRLAGEHKPSDAELRLAFLQDRARQLADEYVEAPTLSRVLRDKLEGLQREIDSLEDQVIQEQDARQADHELAAGLQSLLGEPMTLFDTLPEEKQARIYQILFRGVRIGCVGRGTGRQWRLLEYGLTFDEQVTVAESAVVRLPNPGELRAGKFEAGSLVVLAALTRVGTTSFSESEEYQALTRSQLTSSSGWP